MERVVQADKRVVIVDDSRTIQAILDNAFGARKGFCVVGLSSDAPSAAEMIATLMPDIVTIDLCMPYIDGAALLEMVAHLPDVCKIIVSDQATKNIVMTGKLERAGASACLGKRELIENQDAFFAKVNAAWAASRHGERGRSASTRTLDPAVAQVAQSNDRSNSSYPVPFDERRRLLVLRDKRLADAVHERQFDLITRHMANLADFPVCLVTFIDKTTQWIKSAHGFDAVSTPRGPAFCNYTISQGDAFVVPNALKDERFARNPLVLGSPHIRSYFGHPITARDGTRLGALCLIDVRPRTVSSLVLGQLADMADVVAEMIENRQARGESAVSRASFTLAL